MEFSFILKHRLGPGYVIFFRFITNAILFFFDRMSFNYYKLEHESQESKYENIS